MRPSTRQSNQTTGSPGCFLAVLFAARAPKAGRRTISIPPSIVAELRDRWHRQQEERLALGMGKAGLDDFVVARPGASSWPLDSMTADWARTTRLLRLPKATLHSLPHAHVSALIAAGLDVVTVSRRIGHRNPTTTLGAYAHLFGNTNDRAAAVVEAALAHALAG